MALKNLKNPISLSLNQDDDKLFQSINNNNR